MKIAIGDVTGIVTAVVTIVYVVLTYRLLLSNREALQVLEAELESTLRPYVVIDVFNHPGNPILKLRIRNVGGSAARELQMEVDRSFLRFYPSFKDHNLRDLPIFNKVVETFAPRAELVIDLGIGPQIFQNVSVCPTEFKIGLRYQYGKKTFNDTAVIDLETFRGAAINPEPIVEELRAITKALEKMQS